MKPISLKISAFGPYAKQVALDFEKELHDQDIFVITGPTGAGKTTIFDAICYALYGETSGGERKGEQLRSDFPVKEDLPTAVELIFKVNDKKYRIRRQPKQKQKKKRGAGLRELPAAVELSEIGNALQAPLTKEQEIKQEISAILGLTVDQFRKIVMIPQGAFREFLNANTTNKEELLRKIFGTEVYKTIQEQLHLQATQLEANVLQIRNEIAAELAVLNNEQNPVIQPLIETDQPLPMILEAIQKQLTVFNQQTKAEEQKLTKIKQSLNAKTKAKQEALLINEKFSQHQQATEALKRLEEQKPLFAAKSQEQLEALRAEELLALETEVSKQKQAYEHVQSEHQAKQAELAGVQIKFAAVKKRSQAAAELKQKLSALSLEENQLIVYQEDVKTLNQHQQELLKLKEDSEQLLGELQEKQTLEQQLETRRLEQEKGLEKNLDSLQEQLEWELQNYEKQAQLFMNAAAIRLANQLQIGEACPVCGSTEHPAPNQSNEKILTEAELEALRKKQENLNAELKDCRQQLANSRLKTNEQQQLALAIKELEKIVAEHQIAYLSAQKIVTNLRERIPECYHDEQALTAKIEKLQVAQSELEKELSQMEKDVGEVAEQLIILQTTMENIGGQIEQAKANLKEAEKVFEGALTDYFSSHNAYQEAQREKAAIKQLAHEIEEYNQRMHTTTHLLAQLTSALQGKAEQDISLLNDGIAQLELVQAAISQVMMELQLRAEHYGQILNRTTKKYEQIKHQEDKYAVVGELAALANGRTAGKMTFETYVLSSYFDDVLKAANGRLNKMTAGRYHLLRREEIRGGGRKGLELDVYDSHTCKKRSVNTLSGGESFKASLALALGLSDIVQQHAGGIQLDTMFIDEGFGTLDPDSLEQAIDILMDLQDHGRLVGVISHVSELKERIPAKLMVSTSPEGSTVSWESENFLAAKNL